MLTSQRYNWFHHFFWRTERCSQLQHSVSHRLQLSSGNECCMPL